MQILSVLVCLGFISLIHARTLAGFKPNLSRSHKFKIQETPKPVSPDDRRKLSLFPKSSKKFVISFEINNKEITESPIVTATKKPLMKKLVIQGKRPDTKNTHVEYEAKIPMMGRSASNFFNKESKLVEEKTGVISEEISIEILQENFKDDLKDNDNNSEEESKESLRKVVENKPQNSLDKPSKNTDTVSIVQFLLEESADVKGSEENSKENDNFADKKEYIFLTPSEEERAKTEESEEFVTTEEAPKMERIKRSDNVIEEENLGTTLAGYRYTWRDTRLTNDLAFKNIHS